ncbi:ribonuclease activity regulator RraA [Flexivirga sp. B27]
MSVATAPIIDDDLRHKLTQAGTAAIANLLYKRGLRNTMPHGLRPLREGQPALVGEAFTLRFIPAREDLDDMSRYSREDNIHRRAIEECPAGSVLVIDAQGCTRASSMGDLMATRLRARGVRGVVTDGGYRDGSGIVETNLPCFQAHPAPPATPIALHPVALQEPIGCGGVAVYPGDVVLGDSDGVVVIPSHLVAQVAEEGAASAQYEHFAGLQLKAGRSLFEVFPATDQSKREYDEWVAAGRPGQE